MKNISSNLFHHIGCLSKDAYFIFNTAHNCFHYLNPAFEKIWELPINQVELNPSILLDIIHPEDRGYVQDCYADALQSAQEHKFEFRICPASGQEKYLQLSLYPLDADYGTNSIAGIARDITVLQNNVLYAERINGRKNSMLHILAHDLKGPMGTMDVLAASIKSGLEEEKTENLLQSVEFIQELCQRNISLIRNVIDLEFLESPEVGLHKERVDLVWSINDVLNTYKNSEDIIRKKFTLTSSAEKIYVQIDNLKIIQAFNNLLSNAIKFTPANGLIEVHIQEQHPWVILTVRDNGIGIPDHLQPYIFDKFTKARRLGLNGEETTGLGMSIIKTIVELHGGRIWLESKENMGTAFYIELPML
ncbi:PAS domain-containing protein [Mucilaginibacter robiniae]|uniref:histidine kinase n=1 Tax=Mucilaginibacter robiniae TaxID=2728022 RepID=A0A7L5DYZ0_9SPHI|nr:PAS domain-containing sensor histidine kinase [Mucilaginibacter robiniae]QJD96342.1 PAS domain-containing protein [Mucilaginibacter robiniae]